MSVRQGRLLPARYSQRPAGKGNVQTAMSTAAQPQVPTHEPRGPRRAPWQNWGSCVLPSPMLCLGDAPSTALHAALTSRQGCTILLQGPLSPLPTPSGSSLSQIAGASDQAQNCPVRTGCCYGLPDSPRERSRVQAAPASGEKQHSAPGQAGTSSASPSADQGRHEEAQRAR